MSELCPLCGSSQAREIFRAFRPKRAEATGKHTEGLFGRAGRIVRCTGCGLVRQADPPLAPYEEAEEDVEYIVEERGIRETFRAILDRIEQHRTPPGRLLDIGCGPGLMLDEARARGWDVLGIEPSAWAAAEARRRGLEVVEGNLGSTEIASASIDVITAADVIEHVSDPLSFAQTIHRLLTPGGIVFIATPNVGSFIARLLRRWWWSVIPNHLLFFSNETLDALFRKSGFRTLALTTHPKTFSLDYYAGRFGGYSRVLGGLTRGAARPFGGQDRLVTPDFRDRIAMIARKP